MNKNLILIVVAVLVLFVVFKLMKTMKSQSEIMKSQTDILMAVALKTGAIQPAPQEKQIAGKKEKVVTGKSEVKKETVTDTSKKNAILTPAHKKIVKLFDDEVPKTASQLRAVYNKTAPAPIDAKKFNSMLWNIKNNKSAVNFEKFEDSDSVWGLSEWFEMEDDGNAKLMDEFFNRILTTKKV